MILPNQRGKGMAIDLWQTAMDTLPGKAGAGAIFGEAVCTHTFSQQLCQDTGMLPCGIVLEAIPAKAYATRGADMVRTSLILTTKPLEKFGFFVALPQWCRAEYALLCDVMQLEREVLPNGAGGLAEHSLD